jgi:hypothetical protein
VAKHSYFSIEKYFTVHGFDIIAENEHKKSQTEGEDLLDLELAAVPRCGNRRDIGMLRLPATI